MEECVGVRGLGGEGVFLKNPKTLSEKAPP
jgi:hypothetical protein